jgi:hypothetical protein
MQCRFGRVAPYRVSRMMCAVWDWLPHIFALSWVYIRLCVRACQLMSVSRFASELCELCALPSV